MHAYTQAIEECYDYTPKTFVNGDVTNEAGTNAVRTYIRMRLLPTHPPTLPPTLLSIHSFRLLSPSTTHYTQGSCKLLSLGILHGLPPASLLALFGAYSTLPSPTHFVHPPTHLYLPSRRALPLRDPDTQGQRPRQHPQPAEQGLGRRLLPRWAWPGGQGKEVGGSGVGGWVGWRGRT